MAPRTWTQSTHGNEGHKHHLAAYLSGVRAGYRWRRPFRGPHHRPGAAHDQRPATKPWSWNITDPELAEGPGWPTRTANALAPAGHGPPVFDPHSCRTAGLTRAGNSVERRLNLADLQPV